MPSGYTEKEGRYHVGRDRAVIILPEQLLSATKCRVDSERIKAGVVLAAHGESFRLIAAERPNSSQTIYI